MIRNASHAQADYGSKAALCYVQSGEFTSAQVLLDKCDREEAGTQYLLYLLAVAQNRGEAGKSPLPPYSCGHCCFFVVAFTGTRSRALRIISVSPTMSSPSKLMFRLMP